MDTLEKMMKKIQVSTATNNQLNWLVAKCEGAASIRFDGEFWRVLISEPAFLDYEEFLGNLDYTTDWSQMGPIIEREGISFYKANGSKWWAHPYGGEYNAEGPTSLMAAARCYVVSKLGEEVEVPEELE